MLSNLQNKLLNQFIKSINIYKIINEKSNNESNIKNNV